MSTSTDATNAAVAPADAPPAAPPAPAAPEPAPDDLGDGGKKAIDAERRARRDAEKRVREYEERLKAFEDRDKSDAEKMAERVAKAEARAAESEARTLRLTIASEAGLPADLLEFLTASDEESLRAQVDKLLTATVTQRRTPAPDPTQGARPTGVSQLSRADLQGMAPEAIAAAKAEGRLDDLLGIKR